MRQDATRLVNTEPAVVLPMDTIPAQADLMQPQHVQDNTQNVVTAQRTAVPVLVQMEMELATVVHSIPVAATETEHSTRTCPPEHA
jgi:hypothetical protein